jgi:putative oxidoreductase
MTTSRSHLLRESLLSSARPLTASLLARVVATTSDATPAVARIALGVTMFPHGAQKVLGWFGGDGLTRTLDLFTEQLGIPTALALLAIAAEFLGGIGLVTGALSRVAAFGVACVMIVATFKVQLHNGLFMNWTGHQAGEGFEFDVLALALAVIVLLKGGGAWSLDRLLATRSTRLAPFLKIGGEPSW